MSPTQSFSSSLLEREGPGPKLMNLKEHNLPCVCNRVCPGIKECVFSRGQTVLALHKGMLVTLTVNDPRT